MALARITNTSGSLTKEGREEAEKRVRSRPCVASLTKKDGKLTWKPELMELL